MEAEHVLHPQRRPKLIPHDERQLHPTQADLLELVAAASTLCAEHLDHDYPTDVLSFPMADDPVLMGEILVSADTARREAAARGHPAYHELLLYAVHGTLHLLGYDDHDPKARARMRRAERAALAALGVPPVYGRR